MSKTTQDTFGTIDAALNRVSGGNLHLYLAAEPNTAGIGQPDQYEGAVPWGVGIDLTDSDVVAFWLDYLASLPGWHTVDYRDDPESDHPDFDQSRWYADYLGGIVDHLHSLSTQGVG